MGKSGFKTIGVLLTLRRHSKRHANWTLSIAIFSTLVTIGLFALYLMQDTPEFPWGRTAPSDQFTPLPAGAIASAASFPADGRLDLLCGARDTSLDASPASFMATIISSSIALYSPTASGGRGSVFSEPASCGGAGPIALFVANKPGAQYARDPVIIEDVGIDRIHRHHRAAGFQDYKITRL
jgi:hypothetical protein